MKSPAIVDQWMQDGFDAMDERSREIFRRIVESYLNDGEPVGSRSLSRHLGHMLSPATIRNVMSDLEQLGLIYAPHVSAGRMPTQSGLRFFVDAFMEVGDLPASERQQIETQVTTEGSSRTVEQFLTEASNILSGLSRGAGLVLATKVEGALKHIEFVRLDNRRALVVLVNQTGDVENRIVDLPEGVTPAQLTEASNYLNAHIQGRTLSEARAEIAMPVSVELVFQGAAAAFAASLANTLWLIVAAVIAMYIVLGILYESFIHPITILSTLPSATVGALAALVLTGGQLDMVAVIGIVLLIGLVKKNGIMMIDFALDAERRRALTPEAAIREAARLRFRPILMTTLAALFGALPLMLASGSGAELRQPLGLVMVGGLLVSQVLTVFTTPVVYLFFARLSRSLRRPAPPAPTP